MRISDWSSDVCASDLANLVRMARIPHQRIVGEQRVVEMERAAVERAVAALGRDQPVGRDSQQPFGLVGVEGDAMLAARLAERQRPGERRVEAEQQGSASRWAGGCTAG